MAKKATAKKAAPAAAVDDEQGPRPAPSVRVRATKRGYYDRIREDGGEFLIRPPYTEEREKFNDETKELETVTVTIDEFSTKWMEHVDGGASRKSAKSAPKASARKGASASSSGVATGDQDPLGAGD